MKFAIPRVKITLKGLFLNEKRSIRKLEVLLPEADFRSMKLSSTYSWVVTISVKSKSRMPLGISGPYPIALLSFSMTMLSSGNHPLINIFSSSKHRLTALIAVSAVDVDKLPDFKLEDLRFALNTMLLSYGLR